MACKHLVDVTTTISQGLSRVEQMVVAGGQLERIPPLVYACMARAGKTTFLFQLYDVLKSRGMAPIFITFLDFVRRDGESASQAITRMIALQLMGPLPADEARCLVINEEALWAHIDASSDGKPVVLLIDELNKVGLPLDAIASDMLKRQWLDRPNRYLVVTSHVPLDLDVISMPQSNRR